MLKRIILDLEDDRRIMYSDLRPGAQVWHRESRIHYDGKLAPSLFAPPDMLEYDVTLMIKAGQAVEVFTPEGEGVNEEIKKLQLELAAERKRNERLEAEQARINETLDRLRALIGPALATDTPAPP